jgi:hypothetical protein
MTGPTTTGSIDAKLSLDDSAFKRGMAEAKAEAKQVGALKPEVKVDANVGPALAKLDAVIMAEKRLEAAERAATNSASASYIANMRLDAVMEKRGRTELQVAAATEAAARADRNAEAAEKKHIASTEALNVVKAEALRKSLEQAAASDEEAAATSRGNAANNQRVSGLAVLIALSPLILSAAAPIGAAAVGLGGAFTVMGVSGAFAVKGIKDAMEAGGAAGDTYATGLGVLKGHLDQLSHTSAVGMLGAFTATVGDISARMPALNRMVWDASGALGAMGGTALSGVLTGLQQMNPLIKAGEAELGHFVTWLTSFNGTNGFDQFIKYAVDNLPSVMGLIRDLVTLAGNLLAAFAPLGPVVVGALTVITDILNSFPLPVLAGIATAGLLIGPAFGLAAAAVAVFGETAALSALKVSLFGVSVNLAVPVVGILAAAIAGLGIMAATAAAGTDQGATALINYGDAVERDNGLIGENVRLQAAHAATTKEMRGAADSLGVSTNTVIQAMLGNKDAQDQVNAATKISVDQISASRRGAESMTDASYRLKDAKKALTDGISRNSTEIQNNVDAYHAYKAATEGATVVTDTQTLAAQKQASQYGTNVAAYQAAKDAQDAAKTSTDKQTLAMQLQNNAAGILKGALDSLNGKALSAAQAQNAFDSSLANMGTHVDKVGKQITFTTTNIGDMSAASVALRGQLNGQVANLQSVVEANGGLSESTGKAKAEMVTMRQQIIDNAVAHGVDEDAVTAYVDKLLTIPKDIPPTKLDIDKTKAEADIAAFRNYVETFPVTQRVLIQTEGSVAGMKALDAAQNGASGYAEGGQVAAYRADGGPVNYLASGGFPGGPKGTDTVPAWLTPGEVVIKRASVNSLGEGNLLHANRTGKWPAQGLQQSPAAAATNVTVYIGNEAIDSRMVRIVQEGIDGVSRQIGGMRR